MENYLFSSALSTLLVVNSISLCLGAPILNSTTDKHALISFKNSILPNSRAILSRNWSENASVCDWIGVTCGVRRRVTALKLSGYDLAGDVAPNLGNLTFLTYLDISSNNFTGILPFELSNLRRLKVMNVGANSFTGEIPSWLGSLSLLNELYLYDNGFSGRLPPEIGNLSRLEILNVAGASLTGDIPSSISNISSLKYLNVSYNSLSGSIPTFHNLSKLEELYLTANKLTGWIPNYMCNNMPNIKRFDIVGNKVEGQIPPSIWKCRELEVLALANNNFNGSIPREMGNMSMLRELRFQHNDLTGELPEEIGSLPILQYLSVFNNSLHGSIPSSIFNLSTLKTLGLSLNDFTGSLPLDKGHSLPNLELLYLSSTRLSGPIPTSITNASKLTDLDMGYNSFTGSVPNFGNLRLLQRLNILGNNMGGAEAPAQELTFLSLLTNCRYLKSVQVSDNPLNGILPISVGNFSSSLVYFRARSSNIMGVIPSEIGNLSNLLHMTLAGNEVSGTIPSTVGRLRQIQKIDLSGNQMVGSIPSDLCGLSNLWELSLAGNKLVGPIPECLGEVKSLRNVYLSSNKLNSTIPPKFWTLTDLVMLNLSSNCFDGQLSSVLGNLKAINSLDLSSNQLSGGIPSSIDGCQSLYFLNLSNNQLSGSIPQSLGNVRGLTTLDLSYNNLSGSITNSLELLLYLQGFNVSNNKLEGRIPDGGCFRNFTAESFSHNLALCGTMRFQVPLCSENHGRSSLKKVAVVPSVVLAAIVVIVMLVLVLMKLRKKKKVALSVDISPIIEWRRVSYIELERGTSCFSETNLLGRGSYGSVFEATLPDGLKVAVKVFNLQLRGAVRSFDAETKILSSIRHRNLVRVIGCCSNPVFKALILSYMPNGSLDKWLYSDIYHVDLIQRLKIAVDVATALEYLHHGYTFSVVHCDIKPSNVLLDGDMVAHLADFGISKLFDGGEDFIQTQTLATIGYAAPELGTEGKVSTNGDVYSFGIMLLEMFTGKRPTDDMFGEEMSIKEWVSEAIQQNAAAERVAPALLSREDKHLRAKEQCVLSTFELAIKCVAISPHERINMIQAAASLHKIYATIVTPRRYAFSVN